jgi:two-component system OmpR family sensor kinase
MKPGLDGLGPRVRELVPKRVKALSDRTPLRIKLISAVLALVTLALLVFSVASVFFVHNYLTDQVRQQGDTTAASIITQARVKGFPKLPPPQGGPPVYVLLTSPGTLAEIVDSDGNVIGGSAEIVYSQRIKPFDPAPVLNRSYSPSISVGGKWLARTVRFGDDGTTLTVAVSLGEVNKTVRQLMLVDVLLGTAVVIVLATVGAGIVRASLKPLEEIENTAEAIAVHGLSERVPEQDPRTEVGRLARSLNGMLGQIETAFEAQAASEAQARGSEERMRRFIADASHELRTPLTAIKGFAEFYRQGAARTPEETEKLVGRIESAASRMGLLVEDLLMLARLDQQRPLAMKPVDLLALAADAVQEARVIAPERQIELNLAADAAFQVSGDEPRLRQVLGNLLTNAVVHTPAGTPIEVRLGTGQIDGKDAAVIDVIDQGPGMPREVAERVFERFYRADAARSQGGTGLGLSIVAALVAAHGGLVAVRSEPGKGTTFRVTLPLDF